MSDGTENTPCALVYVSNFSPVALLATTTLAPGITPPPLSTATPEIDDVDAPCAYTGALATIVSTTAATILTTCSVIKILLRMGERESQTNSRWNTKGLQRRNQGGQRRRKWDELRLSRFAQFEALQFPGRGLRQVSHELDPARPLVVGQLAAHELLQRFRQLRRAGHAGLQHDIGKGLDEA